MVQNTVQCSSRTDLTDFIRTLFLHYLFYCYAKYFATFSCDQMSFYSIIAHGLNNWKVIDVVLQIYFVMSILNRDLGQEDLFLRTDFQILTKSIRSFFAWGWNLKRMTSPVLCFVILGWILTDPIWISGLYTSYERYKIAFLSYASISLKLARLSDDAIPTQKFQPPTSFTDHSKLVGDWVKTRVCHQSFPLKSKAQKIEHFRELCEVELLG